MRDQVLFEYAVIRLVPRVERAEFLNVGVVLFCAQKRFLSLRFKLDEVRINAFSADVDMDFIRRQLLAFELICNGAEEGGAIAQESISYRFRWLTANRSTILQFSKVHPGFCKDPSEELVELFRKLVL